MDVLKQNLVKLTNLNLEEIEPISAYFQPVHYSVKSILLEPGSVANAVWFISSGILRAYSIVKEKKRSAKENKDLNRETTNWIVAEGGFLTDIQSFLQRTTTTYYIQALETCSLYKLSYENYLIIQSTFPEISRMIFENTLIRAELRVKMCNLRHPLDRLEMFEKTSPGISGRISVGIQASYLNIDRATLSRLRGKTIRKD